MPDSTRQRRPFRREGPDLRRRELIDATLRVIASRGMDAATVRTISEEAGVTPGLIRHYFETKEDLLGAAYDQHMTTLIEMSQQAVEDASQPAVRRLARFVETTLSTPVTDPEALQLWAGFIQRVRRDEAMRRIHRTNYHSFLSCLEELISGALAARGRRPSPDDLKRLTIASNAVVDGLWLEGSALPEMLGPDELTSIALDAIGAILGLDGLNDDLRKELDK
ncbi:TetR family transcriptional regulator [Aliiruegeria haliotis]|uniref:TetR family transcriptional regulator n=1 Tax=Aliiruegeria haliotis TaxID=1280846 RepID=A0A2T0RRU5_9RHOB|nr:TetR family transcriptional regulator C-terminal domain-containing protein [Aliiruegeria haliotis]PRY23862.1 TetR family transcriptional regulator [Aliiruegeria haliotis]